MTRTTTVTKTEPNTTGAGPRRRGLARTLAVVATIVAAVAVWAVARFGVGIAVSEPQWSGPPTDLPVTDVVLVSAVVSLAGWALLAILERFTARAAHWWVTIAALGAVVSLLGPLTAPGVGGSSRVVLVLLHVVVGAALIPLLYRSSPTRSEPVS